MRNNRFRRVALLGVASQLALLGSVVAPTAALAQRVEYVRLCDYFGAGYQYTPGTDECEYVGVLGYRVITEVGTLTNNSGGATVGNGAFTGSPLPEVWDQIVPPGNNSAFGTNAWAGGDPNSGIALRPPMDPSNEFYSAQEDIYRQIYEQFDGVLPRGPVSFVLREPVANPQTPFEIEYKNAYDSQNGVFEGDFSHLRKFPGSAFHNVNGTAVGTGAQAGAGAAGQDNATAVGQAAQANALNATAIGQGAQANAEGAVALGQGSIADVAGTVSVGSVGNERKIVNVAAGAVTATSTEAVVGAQLHSASTAVAAALGGGAEISASGEWTGPTYTVQGEDHTNVGSALGALDTQVTANTDAIGDLQTDVSGLQTTVATLQTNQAANTEAIGDLQTDVSGLQTTVTTLQTDQTAVAGRVTDLEEGLAAGTVGLVRQDEEEAITVAAETGGETVGFAGTDGDRRLTGVAAGVMGTDAVNLAQLEAALVDFSSSLSAQQGDAPADMGGPEAEGEGAYAAAYGATANGDQTTAVGVGAEATFDGATAIGAGARATADPTTAVGFFAAATGNNASAFGGLAEASGENSTAIGESAVASASGATALGRGAVASAANSVALGAGSTATRGAQADYAAIGLADPQTSAGEVSVGAAGAARQITNVAAGSAPTDAVNVGQLDGVRTEALNYTNLMAAAFNNEIDRVNRRAEAGTAAAMAVAGLVQATTPGASMVTGGVGTWRGASAIAFGLSHRFEGAWTVKAAGSYAERGGGGFNAAFGFEF